MPILLSCTFVPLLFNIVSMPGRGVRSLFRSPNKLSHSEAKAQPLGWGVCLVSAAVTGLWTASDLPLLPQGTGGTCPLRHNHGVGRLWGWIPDRLVAPEPERTAQSGGHGEPLPAVPQFGPASG